MLPRVTLHCCATSNPVLLQILSETRNPLAVQPHMSKCFDSIKSIKFLIEEDSDEPMRTAEEQMLQEDDDDGTLHCALSASLWSCAFSV